MWDWKKDQARQQAALRHNLRTGATWDEILDKGIELSRAAVTRNRQALDMVEKTLTPDACTAPVVLDQARLQKLCDKFAAAQRAKDDDRRLGPVEDAYKPKYYVGDDELILKNAIGQGLAENASADDLALSYRFPERTRRAQLKQLEPLAQPFAVEEKEIELRLIEQMYFAEDTRSTAHRRRSATQALGDLRRNFGAPGSEPGI